MSKNKLELVICRTCLRDNPGEGDFTNFETNAKTYQSAFKEGWLKKTAEIKYQNCFAQCEHFHCVQITKDNEGFLLKKISTPEKLGSVVSWLKEVKSGTQNFALPTELSEHLIGPVRHPQEKYKKI